MITIVFENFLNTFLEKIKNSEKIAMTIPVTQTKKMIKCLCSSIYLQNLIKTTPIPNNPDLEITTIPEGYFAVIKFSGRSSDKNFDKHNKILKQKLLDDNILIKGFAIRATYNSPLHFLLLEEMSQCLVLIGKNNK